MLSFAKRALWALPMLWVLSGCGGGSNGPSPGKTVATLAAPIAYSQEVRLKAAVNGSTERSDIYVRGADGNGFRDLTGQLKMNFNYAPAISPDGKRVAFVSDGQTSAIYTIAIDGSDLQIVAGTGAINSASSPKWSRDGRELIFRAGDSSTLFAVSARGGTARVFFRPASGTIVGFSLSPDGSQLAYILGGTGADSSQVFVVATANSSAPRALTSSQSYKTAVAFSPDGTQLAVSETLIPSPFTELGTLSIYDLSGALVRELPVNQELIYGVTWSPDGQSLAYSGDRYGGFKSPRFGGTVYEKIEIIRADGSSGPRILGIEGATGSQYSPSWGR